MNGERIALSHLRCDEAAEIFGVWMYLDGNRKKIISVLKTVIERKGRRRRVSSSRKEVLCIGLHFY